MSLPSFSRPALVSKAATGKTLDYYINAVIKTDKKAIRLSSDR